MALNKRFPSADQPLNYEHVLFNHLECMSFFVAQGMAELEQMIEIYEQLTIPKTNDKERETLRIFKLVMSDLRGLIERNYEDKILQAQKEESKPEEVISRLTEEKDDLLIRLEEVYYKMLLRYLVVLTNRRLETSKGESRYKASEFWEDLKVELRDILPFDVSIVDALVSYYDHGNKCKDSTEHPGEKTMEIEQ